MMLGYLFSNFNIGIFKMRPQFSPLFMKQIVDLAKEWGHSTHKDLMLKILKRKRRFRDIVDRQRRSQS